MCTPTIVYLCVSDVFEVLSPVNSTSPLNFHKTISGQIIAVTIIIKIVIMNRMNIAKGTRRSTCTICGVQLHMYAIFTSDV